jgi:hypothetical protein
MKNLKILFTLVLAGLIFGFTSCDSKVADVTIRYEVTASTTERPLERIEFSNLKGGENLVKDTATTEFSEELILSSDEEPRTISLYVSCYEDYTDAISQELTLRIYEDDELLVEETITSQSSIYESITAEVPTETKYE